MKHPKYKGNRFERVMAKKLSTDFGADVVRTVMSGAWGTLVSLSDFQGDIFCKSKDSILKQFFFECKHVEGATGSNLRQWWIKAINQANGKIVVIFIRDNVHKNILVVTNSDCFSEQIERKLYTSKVKIKTLKKNNLNFWNEYEKLHYLKSIPVLRINDLVILKYEDWVYIVREK